MGFKDVLQTAGEIRKEMKEERTEKRAALAAHRAEMARIRAIQEKAARESYDAVMQMIRDHNAKHSYHHITLWEERPVEKCGSWTLVQDCKDKNCFRHYDEKKALAAKQPEEPSNPLEALFGLKFEQS